MGRLEGKVAIVTGGATGIGEATSRLFAAEGAAVVIAQRRRFRGEEVAEQIRTAGGEATFLRLDVTSEAEWKEVVSRTTELYGKLNVLVNNAGVSLRRDVEETTLEDWERVMGVNARGVFLGMKYAIAAMKRCDELCSIVNHSSVDGLVGAADLFAYCASKGAVTLMTKSAALSVARDGQRIRVNSIHPGYVKTPMVEEKALERNLDPSEFFKQAGAQLPLGTIGEPLDIAYLDLYLAADESKWVTGAQFTIDGGWTAG